MRKIKFNETFYNLVDRENVMPSHFQATILKEDYTVESITEDALSAEDIKVYEDDELVATYKGYNELLAVSMYMVSQGMAVSIELLNKDYEKQLSDLANAVNTMEQTQTQQAEAIANLTPYTETKTAYFNENEKTFYNVPDGNISVFFDNYNGAYSVSRVTDRVIISFDALAQETNITISVR